jgi:hydrogenase expression/formation protein HypE
MDPKLPVGKLPPDLLARLLAKAPVFDNRLLLGPGIGRDCAVIDLGDQLLVLKSDPITFATDDIGWYAVQVNANDIATTGGEPRWMLATLLMPPQQATARRVEEISDQLFAACRELEITLVGGHSEVTYGLDRPILVGAMIGEVERGSLITPEGASVGDRLLLTKGVPIEATSILARELGERLEGSLSPEEIEQARRFLYEPGISILPDARIARTAGRVSAMHDPTEGGILTALWEMAEASGKSLTVDLSAVPIPALSARICRVFEIDPLAAIASGALLMAVPAEDARAVCQALEAEGIDCAEIGGIEDGPTGAWNIHGRTPLDRPDRDEIARVMES